MTIQDKPVFLRVGDPTRPPRPRTAISPADSARIIRAWRHRAGLTQEHLAQTLGVTFSTVSRWENGHVRPSALGWKALEQISAEYGTPLADEGDPAPPE